MTKKANKSIYDFGKLYSNTKAKMCFKIRLQ